MKFLDYKPKIDLRSVLDGYSEGLYNEEKLSAASSSRTESTIYRILEAATLTSAQLLKISVRMKF